MKALEPRYDSKEFARRGRALYEQQVAPHVRGGDEGKFAAVDLETGEYEIDADDYTATERLLRRQRGAQVWLCRVGDRTTCRIGAASRAEYAALKGKLRRYARRCGLKRGDVGRAIANARGRL